MSETEVWIATNKVYVLLQKLKWWAWRARIQKSIPIQCMKKKSRSNWTDISAIGEWRNMHVLHRMDLVNENMEIELIYVTKTWTELRSKVTLHL